jgi:hypothetical protein
MSTIPASVKAVGQYVKRAEEIEKDASNPDRDVIAFWCRQWAIEKSIPHFSLPGVGEFIEILMNTQEVNKEKAGDKSTGRGVCEKHAHIVFSRADAEDRAGKGTKMTAKLFYNAASFLDMLEQFNELAEDEAVVGMRKYAKWKANDILQALNEGRVPRIGGSDETPAPTAAATAAPAQMEVDNSCIQQSNNSMPVAPSRPQPQAPIATPSAPPTASAPGGLASTIGTVFNNLSNSFVSEPAPSTQRRAPPKGATDPRVQDAMELSSFAIASMKYGDVAGAKAKLIEALRRLE